jgi:hypothetical protein
MKLRVTRLFKYMWDNKVTHQLLPGNYNVPEDLEERTAILAIQFGAAVWVNPPFKKEAPENKAVKAEENKTVKAVLENKVTVNVPAKKKTSRKKKASRKK